MVSSEPTWHMSHVQKRVSKFVNFKVHKVQKPTLIDFSGHRSCISTGCPILTMDVYNLGFEAPIWTCWGSFRFLMFSAFIWAQEVHDFVNSTLRKSHLKRANWTQNLIIFNWFKWSNICFLLLINKFSHQKCGFYQENITVFDTWYYQWMI